MVMETVQGCTPAALPPSSSVSSVTPSRVRGDGGGAGLHAGSPTTVVFRAVGRAVASSWRWRRPRTARRQPHHRRLLQHRLRKRRWRRAALHTGSPVAVVSTVSGDGVGLPAGSADLAELKMAPGYAPAARRTPSTSAPTGCTATSGVTRRGARVRACCREKERSNHDPYQ
jgi:hypothetical protein